MALLTRIFHFTNIVAVFFPYFFRIFYETTLAYVPPVMYFPPVLGVKFPKLGENTQPPSIL